MALVEKFHVVAANHPVGTTAFNEGQLMKLDTTGAAVPYDGSGRVLGLAGDTSSTSASAMPGIYSGWQNRASDSFNETSASSLVTIYHTGGEFATDQFETDVESANVGDALYASVNGKLQAAVLGSVIATLTRAAGLYPSGIPGTDINGDQALRGENSNQYIEFKLEI